jgi:hypothetical protein
MKICNEMVEKAWTDVGDTPSREWNLATRHFAIIMSFLLSEKPDPAFISEEGQLREVKDEHVGKLCNAVLEKDEPFSDSPKKSCCN